MKSVVVTGANRGIGLELVKQLLDSGCRVYATYRSEKGGLVDISNQNLSLQYCLMEPILVTLTMCNTVDMLKVMMVVMEHGI